MGHRANYVLIEDGAASIYFSRWGALSIPAVVLSGPEATIAYVRQLTPDDKLLDDTWAEGGMLLDLDTRRLLFWGGMQIDTHPYLRRAFFKVLPSLWPNWSVAWSVFGVADLARAVGMDVAPLIFSTVHHDRFLAGDEPAMSREQLLEALKTGNASTAFTMRWKDGKIGDYLFVARFTSDENGKRYLVEAPYQILSLGPSLLSLMRSQPTAALPKEESGVREPQCAYVDEAARLIWLGSGAALDPRDIEAIACRWPEWQVQSHTEGLVHQMRLSGRDPSPLMIPEQQAIDELIDELTQEHGMNPGALFQALSRGGQSVKVGKGFFSEDTPPLSSAGRREMLKQLFQTASNQEGTTG